MSGRRSGDMQLMEITQLVTFRRRRPLDCWLGELLCLTLEGFLKGKVDE